MNTDTDLTSANPDTTRQTEPPASEKPTQTAILRLKSAEASATKTDRGSDGYGNYSISETYQQAIRDQQTSLSRQRKNLHTYKIVKAVIVGCIVLAVVLGGVFFVMNHMPDAHETKTIEEKLMDSGWSTDDIGNFDFVDATTVTRNLSGKTEKGTYELTDSNVLIMHIGSEDISYMIEFDSDGNMRWVHSYNGFEKIIYPTATPKSTNQ